MTQFRPLNEKIDELLNQKHLSETNKDLLEEFFDHIRADPNINELRMHKYVSQFNILLDEFIDFDLDKPSKKEMRNVVGKIRSSERAPSTQRTYIVCLKKFFRTIYEFKEDRPKEIQRILNASFMSTPKTKGRKERITAITYEEAIEISEAANNPRDALMPLFFFETGARKNEIRDVRLKDIKLHQNYAEVTVKTLKCDKGPRDLTLVYCIQKLQQWLEQHPGKDNPNAYLFPALHSGYHPRTGEKLTSKGDPVKGKRLNKIFEQLAEKAGVDKSATCHCWRHASATHFGMKWSASRMKYHFGWKKLETAQAYIQENPQRAKKERLRESGIEVEDNGKAFSGTKTCGRCGETWPLTQKYCGNCSLALDQDAAEELKKVEKDAGQTIVQKRMEEGISQDEIDKIAEQVEKRI